MRIQLSNPAQRWLFLAPILLLAGALAFQGGKNGLADLWAKSSQADDWQRAARLEPENAEYWYRLGRYRQLDFEHADPALAIAYYRRALAIDPRSAFYWMDLADAYESAGDPARAREAFETAQSAYPISTEVAWRYGNFLLRQERLPEAFAQIRRAVTKDPKLTTLAVSRCWRVSADVDRILNETLPADSGVYLTALDFFVAERADNAALAVWKRLVTLHPALELRRTFLLLDGLLERDRVEDARRLWQQARGLAGQSMPERPGGSLVWDGGFEGELDGGGFGWRRENIPGASWDFDTETRHAGARSLRVTFDGSSNLDFANLIQIVPVEPNTRYHFAAYLRTEEISTDSGVRFLIAFPRTPGSPSFLTPNRTGTLPWTLEELDFTTGPQTRLAQIVLRRTPSQKFDNKLHGTLWVDDVSLTPVSPEAARPSP